MDMDQLFFCLPFPPPPLSRPPLRAVLGVGTGFRADIPPPLTSHFPASPPPRRHASPNRPNLTVSHCCNGILMRILQAVAPTMALPDRAGEQAGVEILLFTMLACFTGAFTRCVSARSGALAIHAASFLPPARRRQRLPWSCSPPSPSAARRANPWGLYVQGADQEAPVRYALHGRVSPGPDTTRGPSNPALTAFYFCHDLSTSHTGGGGLDHHGLGSRCTALPKNTDAIPCL